MVRVFEPSGKRDQEYVGVLIADVDERPDLRWCRDADRSSEIPEIHRGNLHFWVRSEDWDQRMH